MPLLDQFKPDLVINSAGQDNHFNDPITHMNFSARGYATLNARLKPDIAVLEGGYAVENALPYVNVAIIMAMAGLDTSYVKEPNYDRDYQPQRKDIARYIEQQVADLKGMFLRDEFLKNNCKAGEVVERNREIYYDTDGIRETQHERIRRCMDCAGALSIESTSSKGNHILAVHIPRRACGPCRKQGLTWFEEASTGRFDRVYLQDRTAGTYETRCPTS